MKKIMMIAASIVMLTLMACAGKTETAQTEATEQHEHEEVMKNIIGEEAVITYPTMTTTVKYLSDTKLQWETLDAEGNVKSGTEDISYKRVCKQKFFVNWIEEDGTTISQVVDLGKNTVSVFKTYADKDGRGGRSADFYEGKLQMK